MTRDGRHFALGVLHVKIHISCCWCTRAVSFRTEMRRLEAAVVANPKDAWKDLPGPIGEIESLDDFRKWTAFLYSNLEALAPNRESYSADDYLGAFEMVLRDSAKGYLGDLSQMKSDLARLAWCVYLALETE